MKSITATALAAALASLLLQSAYAADPAVPANRADVKAEARAATQAGDIQHGEAQPKAPATKSTKTRAERKAETRAAQKKGELAPAGSLPPEREAKPPKSTQARAPIKAEAKAATKAGTIQHGEAPAGTK